MEREVEETFNISYVLAVVGAIISIVSVTIAIGLSMRGKMFDEFSNINTQTESSELRDLAGNEETEMPVAALLAIIESGNKCIEEIVIHPEGYKCTLNNGTEVLQSQNESVLNGSEVKQLLASRGGKVNVIVVYDKESTMYRIHIEY